MKRNSIIFLFLLFSAVFTVSCAGVKVIDNRDTGFTAVTFLKDGKKETRISNVMTVYVYREKDSAQGDAAVKIPDRPVKLSVIKLIDIDGLVKEGTEVFIPRSGSGRDYKGFFIIKIKNTGSAGINRFIFIENETKYITIGSSLEDLEAKSYTVKETINDDNTKCLLFTINREILPGGELRFRVPFIYHSPKFAGDEGKDQKKSGTM